MVRYGNERRFPNAKWGAMNIRNLLPCFQVDAKVTFLRSFRITHLGYAGKFLRDLSN